MKLFLFLENKNDKFFSILLVVALERNFLMKHYKEKYLEMSFKDFVERFNISKDNYIYWLSLAFFLINSFNLSINNKDRFQVMILKLKS